MHYGMSPTFSDSQKSLEIFLLDTNNISSIINKVEVHILKYLRSVKNFTSKTELIKQIEEDVKNIKSLSK